MYGGLCSEYSATVEKKKNNNNKNTFSKLLHYQNLVVVCSLCNIIMPITGCGFSSGWTNLSLVLRQKNSVLGWKILGCKGIINSFWSKKKIII